MNWNHAKIEGGGDRWTLESENVTVVRLPGTVYRVYWADGETSDYTTLRAVGEAVRITYGPDIPTPEEPFRKRLGGRAYRIDENGRPVDVYTGAVLEP